MGGAARWSPWLVGVVVFGLLTAALSPRLARAQGGTALAALAGCCFAITDGLTKSTTYLTGWDGLGFLTAWELWALAGFGLLGFLTQQSAFTPHRCRPRCRSAPSSNR